MNIKNAIASLAVRDLALSLQWYERLLGRPADSTPMPEVAEWAFSGGGWLQIYSGKTPVYAGSVTLAVFDLDKQIVALENLSIGCEKPITNEKVKVVMIKDPDGNSIAFAQALDPSIAQ